MTWTGTWRNQYGSTVEITEDADGRIAGWFETALEDSGFHGRRVPIVGVNQGNCLSFACVGEGPAGDMVVSYTGLLREGRLETIWSYVADKALSASKAGAPAEARTVPWWRAVITNVDTFEKV